MNNSEKENKTENNILRTYQLAELAILKSVAKVMDENNIRYYLGYGTLLGAIRHKGFIPWDDDIDIFVPRPDYEKFIKIADEILEYPYILNYYKKDSPSVFTNNLLHIENPNLKIWQEKGGTKLKQNIWIDIFPLDGLPDSMIIQKWMFLEFRILYILLRLSRSSEIGVEEHKKRPLMEEIGIWMNKHMHIGKMFSYKKILEIFDSIRLKYSYDECNYVYGLTIDYMEDCICKKQWFGKGIKGEFENCEFCIPIDSSAVLTQFYGDYMELPPVEKRTYKHSIGFVVDKSTPGSNNFEYK